MAKKKSMKIDVKVQEALANLDADIIGVAEIRIKEKRGKF
jgi:hypothetical protein